jgi:hypothetical protein
MYGPAHDRGCGPDRSRRQPQLGHCRADSHDGSGVDRGCRRRDRPLTARELQGLEVLVRGLVRALAEMQEKAGLPLDLGEEGLRIARVNVGDAAAGRREERVVGLLDIADDPPVVAADACSAEQRDPLRGCHAAQQRLGLDVANEGGQELGRFA